MIDWMLVLVLPVVVIFGVEFGLRRLEPRERYCFLPIWTHRALNYAGIAGVVLFVEATRVAWGEPTQENVFTMILGATLTFLGLVALTDREMRRARQELRRLEDQDVQRAR